MGTAMAHRLLNQGVAVITWDRDGEVTDDSTAKFLQDFMEEFREFIIRVLTVVPRPTARS